MDAAPESQLLGPERGGERGQRFWRAELQRASASDHVRDTGLE